MSQRFARKLAVLAMALALILPWGASAAPLDSASFREDAAPEPGLWERLAGWLTRVWAENGCLIDPGGCTDGEPDPGSNDPDNGCIADPSGGTCRDGQ